VFYMRMNQEQTALEKKIDWGQFKNIQMIFVNSLSFIHLLTKHWELTLFKSLSIKYIKEFGHIMEKQ
jgi:hypothetical protein